MGPNGQETLADLFGTSSRLLVYQGKPASNVDQNFRPLR
jgi:predicted dithiol-disulfide oxidoreductase (DUF899 family)